MVCMYKLVTCFDKLGHVVFGKKKKNGETLYYLTNGNGAFAPIKRSDVLLHQSEIENVKVVGNKIIPFNVKPQVEVFLFNNRFNDIYTKLYYSKELDDYYYKALDAGDKLIKKYPELVKSLAISRGNIFSSDREVAAMVMALSGMLC